MKNPGKKKTVAQNVGDNVREAADKLKRVRKKIKSVEISDDFHLADIKKWEPADVIGWLGEVSGHALKLSGVSLLWLTEKIMRAMNGVMVDNTVLRGVEQKFANKKNDGFAKNHPAVMSYLMYYAIMLMTVLGGRAVYNALDKDDSQTDKKEQQADTKKTNEEITETMQMVDPADADFVERALQEYWAEISIGLTELETYRAVSKRHGTEKRETNGLGCTWHYKYDSSGKLRRYPNRLGDTKKWSKDTNYEQCKYHLLYETLPYLRGAIKNKDNINARLSVALVWAGYQRPADMDGIAKRISVAKTRQQVADAFAYSSVSSKWREGTLKRRWWCAAYAVGAISIQDFLELSRDGFSRINLNNVYRNGHFKLGAETVKYALARAKGGNKSGVKTFLEDFEEGRNILAQIKTGQNNHVVITIEQEEIAEQGVNIEESMGRLNKADKLLGAGNYEEATKLYLEAIEIDADNMEAYSSLALTYKKLGDKNKSIEYYEKCIQTVKQGNARMNANKSLLLDRAVKAASYYNAGAAREGMAKIYKAQGNMGLAQKNFRAAIKNYQTALENADMGEISETHKQTYKKAINRVNGLLKTVKGKDRKLAYESGIKQMHQKNAKRDILLYGSESIVRRV